MADGTIGVLGMLGEYINKITCGDCLDVLKQLPDACVDLLVTDPRIGQYLVEQGKYPVGKEVSLKKMMVRYLRKMILTIGNGWNCVIKK